jgi:CRP/FNR family transcriptional regulator, cyclic AMP receptor protein
MAINPISKGRFASVPEALSRPLFVAARLRGHKAGEVLFAAGDAGDGCYLLDRGLLKVTLTSSRGEERTIAILGPGAVVGELSMIDGRPRSASVVALNDCLLRFTSREAFAKGMATHPEAYQALVAILAFRLRQADEGLAATTFLTVKGRVARALVELAEYVGIQHGTNRAPREDQPGRYCGDGRRGTGKCESRHERVAAAQSHNWIPALLLSQ